MIDNTDIQSYRFGYKKFVPILPAVYDESLSYLEALAQYSAKLNEVIERINTVTTDAVEQAKHYTDSKIAEQTEIVQNAVREVENLARQIEAENARFERVVNARLDLGDSKIRDIQAQLIADIGAVNQRTDLAIEQNNEYILSILPQFLSRIKVINYFTGELVEIQNMFDYLANLHTENSIVYNELVERNKTYNELRAYNMTYTQLVMNGGSIIV